MFQGESSYFAEFVAAGLNCLRDPARWCYTLLCGGSGRESKAGSARSQVRASHEYMTKLCGGQAMGVRVGGVTLGPPEVTTVTNHREFTHATSSGQQRKGKKAFRRALAVAARLGQATYRGQVLRVSSSMVPFSGHRLQMRTNTERLQFLSWNCSGLSQELFAELTKWLEQFPSLGFFALQETHWNFTGEWTAGQWHFCHTTSGQPRSGGILVGLSSACVDRESIRWQELIPGRLFHTRFYYNKQQFDIVTVYQHAFAFVSGEQKTELLRKRRKLWQSLDKLLGSLPVRSSLAVMGDFNITLEPHKGVAGYGIHAGLNTPEYLEDRCLIMETLKKHNLCALNTWSRKTHTYKHPRGQSQIDYICVRQAISDGTAKTCTTVQAPVAAWRSSGHEVLLANIPLNWRPWIGSRKTSQKLEVSPFPKLEVVIQESCPSPQRLNGALKQHCEQVSSRVKRPPLKTLDAEIIHLWQLGRVMRQASGGGFSLGVIFRSWKQCVDLQRAHKELRKAARARKREQLLTILEGAESAVKRGDTRALYQYVRLLSPKISSKKVHLRGSKGELLEPSQECRMLAEYATTLFTGAGFGAELTEPLPIEWFTKEAWVKSLRSLKSGKAVPRDAASIRSWKEHAEDVSEALCSIAANSVSSARPHIPKGWCAAQLVWIPKPQKTPSRPQNLRSLGLMSADTKAFLHILKNHGNGFVQERLLRYPQFAYRQGTSTVDPILRASMHCSDVRKALDAHSGDLTSRLLRKTEAELVGGLMCSLDLEKAFDSVDYSELHDALLETGMPSCLAGVLMDVHVQTVLNVVHGGEEKSISMSRGLRQGCPVAPMLYAAFTCRLCSRLDSCIEEGFAARHLSIYADDKHAFWSISSKADFFRAQKQLGRMLSVLQEMKMKVNFAKSAVVYSLRGRAAEEIVKRYTQWRHGVRCFVVMGHSCYIPIRDRITYLGVVLSYGAFEHQTTAYRVERATQNFRALHKVLRTQSALGNKHKLRLYFACVWTSLQYGLTATGITPGCLASVCSCVAQHLRKVLRLYHKGITNKQVLEDAGLDVAHALKMQSEQQLARIQHRLSQHDAGDSLELRRAQGILMQLSEFSESVSYGSLCAVTSDQVACVTCPVCGLEFAGDTSLQNHIAVKHSFLNAESKLTFVRSKHSLFGTSICRFCRTRCYNWQALEKHLTEGWCLKLKSAVADGKSFDALLEEVIAAEATNPPTPPDAALVHAPPLVQTDHEVLTCPLHEVPRHLATLQHDKSRCGLCGQIVKDASRIKTHWRASHPKAWEMVEHEAEGAAKAMSSTFRSPCCFCGMVTKKPQLHATKCSPFFQVAALRYIRCKSYDLQTLEGVRLPSLRQHERDPLYSTWKSSTTPIGMALGVTDRSGGGYQTRDDPERHSGSGGHDNSLKVSSGNNVTGDGGSGLHRFFLPKKPGPVAPMSSAIELQTTPDLPITCRVKLHNPHSLCYVNASVIAVIHALCCSNVSLGRMAFLTRLFDENVNSGSVLRLGANLMFRALLPRWTYDSEQKDAAEYLLALLDATHLLPHTWTANDASGRGRRGFQGGTIVPMRILDRPSSLQAIINAWEYEDQFQHALVEVGEHVVVQLGRYRGEDKIFTEVDFLEHVTLPTQNADGTVGYTTFRPTAAIIHLGRTIRSGHYQAVLRVRDQWWLSDDERSATILHEHPNCFANVYLVFLSKQ